MRRTQLAARLRSLEQTLSEKLGPFNFFALLWPEEGHGWDLVFIAPWADRLPLLDATRLMIDGMKEVFDQPTMRQFSRILAFQAETRAMNDLYDDFPAEHGLIEIEDEDILGLTIRRGYIITCKDRPVEKPAPHAKAAKRKQPAAVS